MSRQMSVVDIHKVIKTLKCILVFLQVWIYWLSLLPIIITHPLLLRQNTTFKFNCLQNATNVINIVETSYPFTARSKTIKNASWLKQIYCAIDWLEETFQQMENVQEQRYFEPFEIMIRLNVIFNFSIFCRGLMDVVIYVYRISMLSKL